MGSLPTGEIKTSEKDLISICFPPPKKCAYLKKILFSCKQNVDDNIFCFEIDTEPQSPLQSSLTLQSSGMEPASRGKRKCWRRANEIDAMHTSLQSEIHQREEHVYMDKPFNVLSFLLY